MHSHKYNNGGQYGNLVVSGTFSTLAGEYTESCPEGHSNCLCSVASLVEFPKWVWDDNLWETDSQDENTIGHTHKYKRIKILTTATMLSENNGGCDGEHCLLFGFGHVALTYEVEEELESSPSLTAGSHGHKISTAAAQYISPEGTWNLITGLTACSAHNHPNCKAVINEVPGGWGWMESIYDDYGIYYDAPPLPSTGVETLDATNVAPTSATLNGNLFSTINGSASCFFRWDTEDWYSQNGTLRNTTASQSVSEGNNFSKEINGISPHVRYYFEAYATEGEEVNGGLDAFEYGTATVTTLPATDVDYYFAKATLNGESEGVDQVYFKIGLDNPPSGHISKIPAAASFSMTVHKLARNRTYYFQAVGVDSEGAEQYGDILSFDVVLPPGDPAYVTKLAIHGQPLVPLQTVTLSATDPDSIAKYGRRTYSLNTQLSLSQDDTQIILDQILEDNKNPRVNNLIVTFQNLKPGTLKDSVITADISTRITLINTRLGLNTDYFINNIKHTIIDAGMSYTVQWRLERIYD